MKNIHTYLILIFLFIAMAGCEDEFEKEPLDAPSDANFYSTREELQLAINGVYTGLWWDFSSSMPPVIQLLDTRTDIAFYRGGAGGLSEMALGAHSSDNDAALSTWNHFYSSIAKANMLLQNMERAKENVSEEFYAQIQAEARFLRAFFYHFLTELYGDVPLLLEVPEAGEAQIGSTSKSAVVEQIMKDLDFAIPILPVTREGGDKGLATKGAALTLKARTALYNEDFQTAAQAAREVINLSEYTLFTDYENLFKYEGVRNSEVILDYPLKIGVRTYESPVRYSTRNGLGFSSNVPSQFLVDTYQCIDGLPIDESPLYDPADPFANRDPRLDASIIRPQSLFMGYVFETHPDSVTTWLIEDGDSTRVENKDTTNPFASFTGYCWRKYLDEQDFPDNRRQTELNPIYMRYAEVLLIYAEANIELGTVDPSVLNALNQVRARGYGVDASQTDQYPAITTTNAEELRIQVRYERKVELAGEGFRWFDIKRWQIGEEVLEGPYKGRPIGAYTTISSVPQINEDDGYHPEYGSQSDLYRTVEVHTFNPERDYLWPIPQKEVDVNDAIEQNPNY